MSNKFYGDEEEQNVTPKEPLVPSVLKSSPEMIASTLPNGNQILQSSRLTETVRQWRRSIINEIESLKAEWGTQKSAFKNEVASAKDYLEENIFTDIYENRELVVPASILSLGAFFSGRVLSNKANWGGNNMLMKPRMSIMGIIFTSLPCRLILPLAMAATVFHQITPVTSENTWRTLEKDALPAELVTGYKDFWNTFYREGLLKKKQEWCNNTGAFLQRNIRSLRDAIGTVGKD